MSSCPTCHEPVVPGDNFCGACGSELVEDDAAGDTASRAGAGDEADDGDATETDDEAGSATTVAEPLFAGDGLPAGVAVDDEPTSTDMEAGTAPPTATEAHAGVDLVTCPQCDARNAAQRSRCARCGQALRDVPPEDDDLELADLPSREDDPADDVADDLPRRDVSRRPRRVPGWVWVILLGLVVGAAIGLASAAGIGPLAGAATTPAVTFDAQAYPEPPGPLRPSLVGGTDVRDDVADRTFDVRALLDGDPTTAWSPVDTDGSIELRFDNPVWITGLELANGDQFDPEAFEATARVRTLGMDMGDGTQVRATLIDGDGRQILQLPTPALTDQVVLTVEGVTAGDDVALSDVEFLGHVATAEDAAAWLAD